MTGLGIYDFEVDTDVSDDWGECEHVGHTLHVVDRRRHKGPYHGGGHSLQWGGWLSFDMEGSPMEAGIALDGESSIVTDTVARELGSAEGSMAYVLRLVAEYERHLLSMGAPPFEELPL